MGGAVTAAQSAGGPVPPQSDTLVIYVKIKAGDCLCCLLVRGGWLP